MSRESKFLSRILRHEPELIEVQLDRHGWVRIDELLQRLKKAGHSLTKTRLNEIIETDDKQRFSLSSDGMRIRAAQGHSIHVDLGLSAVRSPKTLYHGTASQKLDAIFETGLNSGRRQQVHLSLNVETASRVGRRRDKSIVLTVDAAAMHANGHVFYLSDNGVWLTDSVPASYLRIGANP